jgi:hypothetical protein
MHVQPSTQEAVAKQKLTTDTSHAGTFVCFPKQKLRKKSTLLSVSDSSPAECNVQLVWGLFIHKRKNGVTKTEESFLEVKKTLSLSL